MQKIRQRFGRIPNRRELTAWTSSCPRWLSTAGIHLPLAGRWGSRWCAAWAILLPGTLAKIDGLERIGHHYKEVRQNGGPEIGNVALIVKHHSTLIGARDIVGPMNDPRAHIPPWPGDVLIRRCATNCGLRGPYRNPSVWAPTCTDVPATAVQSAAHSFMS